MSQVKVREVIDCFCTIISYFKFSQMTAEDFRLAKFNKSTVDNKMWKFLYELLQFTFDHENLKQVFEYNQTTLRRIQINMIKLGYKNTDFNYSCELVNQLEEGSSREILLASAWLISTQDIIEKFLKKLNYLFDEEYFKDHVNTENESKKLKKEMDHLKLEKENLDDVNLKLNYLKRLEHRFKSKLNSLHSILREKCKLTHEVHDLTKYSQQKLFGNLSCHNVYVIKNDQYIERLENYLEEKLEILNALENWLDNEDIFWEWMESVVDEKLENSNQSDHLTTNDFNLKFDDNEVEKILGEKQNLDTLLSNLKVYVKLLKQKILDEKIDANLTCEHDELVKNFQNDLEIEFKRILESDNLNMILNANRNILLSINLFENRLVLNKNKLNKTANKLSESLKSTTAVSIQERVNHLENKINFLNSIYLENKKNIQLIIEKHINDLKDCYAIYF